MREVIMSCYLFYFRLRFLFNVNKKVDDILQVLTLSLSHRLVDSVPFMDVFDLDCIELKKNKILFALMLE